MQFQLNYSFNIFILINGFSFAQQHNQTWGNLSQFYIFIQIYVCMFYYHIYRYWKIYITQKELVVYLWWGINDSGLKQIVKQLSIFLESGEITSHYKHIMFQIYQLFPTHDVS